MIGCVQEQSTNSDSPSDDQEELVEQLWGETTGNQFAVRDGSSQNNHSLLYRFDPPENERCHRIELHLTSWVDSGEGRVESDFLFSIDEVRVFGLANDP